jgi:hypothetical protein
MNTKDSKVWKYFEVIIEGVLKTEFTWSNAMTVLPGECGTIFDFLTLKVKNRKY